MCHKDNNKHENDSRGEHYNISVQMYTFLIRFYLQIKVQIVIQTNEILEINGKISLHLSYYGTTNI